MATEDKINNHISKNDETPKFMMLKTISLFSIFFSLGIAYSVLGTTMTHVEKLYGFEPRFISVIYCGYMVGALVCAFLISRLNAVKSFIFFNTMMGLCLIATVFSINAWMFTGIMTVLQVAAGFIDAAGQSYGVNTWLNHKFKNSFVQVLHIAWSLGGIVGSFILNKFMCELHHQPSEDLNFLTADNKTSLGNDTFCKDGDDDIKMTKHAYILSGSIVILLNLPFVIVLILAFRRKKNFQPNVLNPSASSPMTNIPTNTFLDKGLRDKLIIINILIFSFLFTVLGTFSESPMIMMITSFGVKHLKWSVSKSGLLLTLYYSTHMSSRVVNIFLSVVVKPGKLLLLALVGTLLSSILMCFVDYYDNIIWPAVAFIGFSIGIIFPGIVIWLSENTKLDGKVGAALVFGVGFGTITWPHVLDYLVTNYDSLYFIYMIITAASIHLTLLAIQLSITRFWWRKKQVITLSVIESSD